MSNYFNRISKRSQKILESFGEKKEVPLNVLINQINDSGGMGSRIIELHPQILKFASKKRIKISDLIEEAFFQAIKMGHTYVGTEHLLLSALVKTGFTDVNTVSSEVERINSLPILLKQTKSSKSSILNNYGTDLTRRYIFYPKEEFVEREEVNKILKVLLQKNEPNVLMLGGESYGKDGIMEALARKISYLDVPAYFVGMYVIDFNFQGFLAGLSSSVDAFENSLKNLSIEVASLGRCIIVIKQLPNMLLASLFRNFVETLNEAGAKIIVYSDNESEDLFYGFSIVDIQEPNQKATKDILKMESQKLQLYFIIKIPQEIINYVYTKAKNEMKDQLERLGELPFSRQRTLRSFGTFYLCD